MYQQPKCLERVRHALCMEYARSLQSVQVGDLFNINEFKSSTLLTPSLKAKEISNCTQEQLLVNPGNSSSFFDFHMSPAKKINEIFVSDIIPEKLWFIKN